MEENSHNSTETDGVAHCFSCVPIICNCSSLLQAVIRFLGIRIHTQHPHDSSSLCTSNGNGAYRPISSSPELCYPGGSDLPPTMADPPPDGLDRESAFSRHAPPPPRRSTGGGGQTN